VAELRQPGAERHREGVQGGEGAADGQQAGQQQHHARDHPAGGQPDTGTDGVGSLMSTILHELDAVSSA